MSRMLVQGPGLQGLVTGSDECMGDLLVPYLQALRGPRGFECRFTTADGACQLLEPFEHFFWSAAHAVS